MLFDLLGIVGTLGYLAIGCVIAGIFWSLNEHSHQNRRDYYSEMSPKAQLIWKAAFVLVFWPAFLCLLLGWSLTKLRVPPMPRFSMEEDDD